MDVFARLPFDAQAIIACNTGLFRLRKSELVGQIAADDPRRTLIAQRCAHWYNPQYATDNDGLYISRRVVKCNVKQISGTHKVFTIDVRAWMYDAVACSTVISYAFSIVPIGSVGHHYHSLQSNPIKFKSTHDRIYNNKRRTKLNKYDLVRYTHVIESDLPSRTIHIDSFDIWAIEVRLL